jgi:dihydroorotate dehydrogenase electron transfer subunit
MTTPVQTQCEIISNKRVGAYHHITLSADKISERAKPGNFIGISVGDEKSSMLLRRSFAIYQASGRGPFGGTIEIIVSAHGAGTRWLVNRAPHEKIDVVGPLGNSFGIPKEPVRALLIGGGYGSAALFSLGDALRQRNCRVEMIVGAATAEKVFAPVEGKRSVHSLSIFTEDGSMGTQGRVTDPLESLLDNTDIIYACGPMGMLQAISKLAAKKGIPCQSAVEESMACGIGICMTCVLPVIGDDGQTRMVRSCTEGPIFEGSKVRWDDIGTVPPGTYGGPK